MSIVTLEHLRLRMEREFFTRALADLEAAESFLSALERATPPPEWPGLPAVCAALRHHDGAGSAGLLASALRRDRARLRRRLTALVADFGAAAPWVAAAAARLAEPPGPQPAPVQAHLDPAHA